MYITREDYDGKPLLIKQGALLLWGVPLAKWVRKGAVRHLYRLNDFYAEMCYDENSGRLIGISTFTNSFRLSLYLDQLKRRELISNIY